MTPIVICEHEQMAVKNKHASEVMHVLADLNNAGSEIYMLTTHGYNSISRSLVSLHVAGFKFVEDIISTDEFDTLEVDTEVLDALIQKFGGNSSSITLLTRHKPLAEAAVQKGMHAAWFEDGQPNYKELKPIYDYIGA